MIKLLNILENKILVPRRPREERAKNYLIATQKKIQQYMKGGGEGYLDLSNTPITSLPSGLSVGGNLYLYNTKITSLPSGLKVGGGLYLSSTPITSLPSGLKVGGGLYLRNTPLSKSHTKEQIKQMAPGVKGGIYI
jgi:hypothetical protein